MLVNMSENSANTFLNSFTNYETHLHQTSSKEFSLEPVKLLLERLGRPDKNLKIIHVAGTKGKGSTAVMIASILKEAGYSVGLYTSPHLWDLNERIRILKPFLSSPNVSIGDPSALKMDSRQKHSGMTVERIFSDSITDQELSALIEQTRAVIEDVHRHSDRGLTFFEVLTALALSHFARENVDYVVLETGLGGRLDATNAVDSLMAVITPISLDHQNILGDIIEDIAAEKSGIIKSKSQRVVIAPQFSQAEAVLRRRCQEFGIEPVWAAENAVVELAGYESGQQILNFKTPPCEYQKIKLPLAGAHQRLNAATAVCAAEVLKISFAAGRLNAAFSSIVWPGRFEVISQNPTVILDCAHNEASMECLIESLKDMYPGRTFCFVLGVSKDKNIEAMGRLLQKTAKCVILTRAGHPRAYLFTEADAKKYFPQQSAVVTNGVDEALKEIQHCCFPGDVIVVTGSIFLVGEFRKHHV